MGWGRRALRIGGQIVALATVVAALLCPPAMATLQAQQASAKPRIYVLTGRDADSDAAALAILREAGYLVERGVDTATFDGTQANLSDYDAVVVLNHANWSASVPTAGLFALRRYIESGGAAVFGEWFVWKGLLSDLLPVTSCGFNTADETIYTRTLPNLSVNRGLPISFRFSLSHFAGSEGCMRPRAGANVLYRSSNGGGASGSAGVVAWNARDGRVVVLSNMLASNELQSEHMARLLQNIVAWIATQHDVSAPVIERVQIEGAGELVRSRQVQISTFASDSGRSGVGSLYIIEYTLSSGPRPRFRAVARSGWLSYAAASSGYSWTLTNQPGVHYLQVWAADRAGNISVIPQMDFVSYFDGSASVAAGERTVYRIRPALYAPTTVSMSALNGDPDLYVYNAEGEKVSEDLFTATIETAGFIADGEVYQIEVAGLTAGIYYLETSNTLTVDRSGISTPGRPYTPLIALSSAPSAANVALASPPIGRGVDLFIPLIADD
jgi:hypothetical protein